MSATGDPALTLARTRRASGAISVALLLVTTWRAALLFAPARVGLVGLTFSAAALGLWALATRAKSRVLAGRRTNVLTAPDNQAAALALAAHEISIAFIVSRALAGASFADLAPGLTFAGLGLLTWAAFVMLFRGLTVYDDAQEIAGENQAAALSYAGASVAIAIIIAHAVDGHFVSWGRSIAAYVRALGIALSLYPLRQLVVQGLFLGARPRLRGHALDHAIGQERRLDVAAIEAGTYVVAALLLTGLL